MFLMLWCKYDGRSDVQMVFTDMDQLSSTHLGL